jgi:hypothetical protein
MAPLKRKSIRKSMAKLKMPLLKGKSRKKILKKSLLEQAEEYVAADVLLFSACQDSQQTVDVGNVARLGFRKSRRGSTVTTSDGGACTAIMLKLLWEYHDKVMFKNPNKKLAFATCLLKMREDLKRLGYEQIPQLTSSRPLKGHEAFHIIPKDFSGTKRALVIGITYVGSPWFIDGSHNDCKNMIKYLKLVHNFKDEEITILMDDGQHTHPTKANIEKAFYDLAFSCQPGDAAFFHYAGHGGFTPDLNGDESNGFDDSIYPVDYMDKGEIIDDDIFKKLLIPLPKGVRMTAIVDCCHSGTIFDLPFEYDKKIRKTNYKTVRFPHMGTVREERRRIAEEKEGTTIPMIMTAKNPAVPKPDLTRPPIPQKIEKATVKSKSQTVSIKKKKPLPQKRAPKKPLSSSSGPLPNAPLSCAPVSSTKKASCNSRVSSPTKRQPKNGMSTAADESIADALEPAESITQEKQKLQPKRANGNSPRLEKTQSSALGQPSIVAFPLEARVAIHGLGKTPKLNGMTGIIRSGLSLDGCQRVYVEGTAKTAAIKPANLQLEDLTPLLSTSKMESSSQTDAKSPRRKRTQREQARQKRKPDKASPTTNKVQKDPKADGTKKESPAKDIEVKPKGGFLGLFLPCLGRRKNTESQTDDDSFDRQRSVLHKEPIEPL